MKKKFVRAAVLGAALTVSASAYAAEAETAESLDEYTIDETIVTATRSEKRDVDIPAATDVITAEDIKAKGAKNAAEALYYTNGFIAKTHGPIGASFGTMTNEASLRGNKSGTLILVNGNPVSWRGKYDLSDIPADTIERIEIVKGGGSVLYGSSALAGVINIITKTAASNQVSVGFGNYGQQKYHLNVGDDKYSITYDLNKWDEQKGVTLTPSSSGSIPYRADVKNIRNENIGINISPDEHWRFVYGHYKSYTDYDYYATDAKGQTKAGDLYRDRKLRSDRDMAQISYKNAGWDASMYFNTMTLETTYTSYFNTKNGKKTNTPYDAREKNVSYGIDAQKTWNVGDKTTFIAGIDWMHEIFHSLPTTPQSKEIQDDSRNIWGIFGQWEQKFDKKNSLILGARETWTTNTTKSNGMKNYSNFSASAQYLYKLDDTNSLYASANQSFRMPTFREAENAEEATNLKPQRGVNYELGWKKQSGNHLWKAALFHTKVKDKISTEMITFVTSNEDFKNTGLELSCEVNAKNGMNYNYGITWQNPVTRNTKYGPDWVRDYGKFQLVGGIGYHKGKWRTALNASYLADRSGSTSGKAIRLKPYLLTSFTLAYAPNKYSELELSVNNLLNRKDITTHSASSFYYCAGRSFMLTYTQKW